MEKHKQCFNCTKKEYKVSEFSVIVADFIREDSTNNSVISGDICDKCISQQRYKHIKRSILFAIMIFAFILLSNLFQKRDWIIGFYIIGGILTYISIVHFIVYTYLSMRSNKSIGEELLKFTIFPVLNDFGIRKILTEKNVYSMTFYENPKVDIEIQYLYAILNFFFYTESRLKGRENSLEEDALESYKSISKHKCPKCNNLLLSNEKYEPLASTLAIKQFFIDQGFVNSLSDRLYYYKCSKCGIEVNMFSETTINLIKEFSLERRNIFYN